MSFYDKLLDNLDNYEELTELLVGFDRMLEYLHNKGLCIYDFNPKKINLYNGKFTPESFNNVVDRLDVFPNMKKINLYQAAKIGLMAFNKQVVDGKMNQEFYDFIRDNLDQFNFNGNIPEEIMEYYGELFQRLNIIYLNKFLLKKKQDSSNKVTKVMRKNLSTAVGEAYIEEIDSKAYVNILFIPSILVLFYLIGLIIFILVIK